jgi:hypothetical protein
VTSTGLADLKIMFYPKILFEGKNNSLILFKGLKECNPLF